MRKHPDHGGAQDQSYSSACYFRIAFSTNSVTISRATTTSQRCHTAARGKEDLKQNRSMEEQTPEALHPAADQEDEKRLWMEAQPMRFHRRMKRSWTMLAQQKVLTGFRAMDSTRLIHHDHEARPNPNVDVPTTQPFLASVRWENWGLTFLFIILRYYTGGLLSVLLLYKVSCLFYGGLKDAMMHYVPPISDLM